MHQRNFALDRRIAVTPEQPDDKDQFIDLDRLLNIAWRRARVVALAAAVGLALGAAYLLMTPPTFTAATRILLDENLTRYAQEERNGPGPMQIDTMMSSEVEILRSSRLAHAVVEDLDLHQNEAFLDPPMSPAAWLRAQVRSVASLLTSSETSGAGPSEAAQIGRAAAMLQANLVAERVGRSFAIEVRYSAKDAGLAGAIARAYADQYLADQLNANFDATQQATVWLQGRLEDLRTDWLAASLRAERFRAENDLTAVSGELVSDQQLTEVNEQLILAQAETANARARYERFQSIIEEGPEQAVLSAVIPTDIANSASLNELKSRYLNMVERETEIAERFGEDHPQAVTLRRQAADLSRQIYQELQQVTASYRNEYEVAQAREQSLRENVGARTGETSLAGEALVELRELEQQSAALGTLYQTFLARYEEASQQQTFPIAKARVISQASNPTRPSAPSKTMTLGLALVLGIFAGAGIGAFQEFRERFFRTGDDVRRALGMDFLGYLPLVSKESAEGEAVPIDDDPGPALLKLAVNAPSSLFAETLRNARLVADVVLQEKQSRVIAFASVLPREGKTTVAANFAGMLAATGQSTLLIDADMRNPGLTRRLAIQPKSALVDVLMNGHDWRDALLVSRQSGLAILPASGRQRLSHTADLLSGKAMRSLVEEARGSYRYIIVDLPPLGPVVDARAFAPLADAFIIVSAWGTTPRALLQTTLENESQVAGKALGAILNKTDMTQLTRYSTVGGAERYMGEYSDYYLDGAAGSHAASVR
jgi:succinoglycan biosynthesis transport protein ExoP